MEMTKEEILRSYQEAKKKNEQIKILAQLNLCSQDNIIEILKEMGVDGRALPRLHKPKPAEQQEPTIDGPAPEIKEAAKVVENDTVNHPSHYTDGKIEVIDYIEDKKLGYHLGNAVKYISRAGKKDPDKEIEDLKKAAWYINREIAYLERQKEGIA